MGSNTTLTVSQALASPAPDLHVCDGADNLLNAPHEAFANAASVTLTGAPTLAIGQLAQLLAIPGFAVDTEAHVRLTDSLTNIAAALASNPACFGHAGAVEVLLDGSHLGADAASLLVLLQSQGKTLRFTAIDSHRALPIMADAQDLAFNAATLARLAATVPLHFTVIDPRITITAEEARAVTALPGFRRAGFAVTVADTAASLAAHAASVFGHNFAAIVVTSGDFAGPAHHLLDPALRFHRGASATLTASAMPTAAQAEALASLPGFMASRTVTISVRDTVANLLALPAAARAIASATLPSEPDITLSASQAAILAALPEFRTGGASVTVADSVAAVLAHAEALTILPAGAAVADRAAAIGLETPGLQALGRHLRSVRLTDSRPISAAAAAAVAPFAPLLVGPPAIVADNATNAIAHLAALEALGPHISMEITDTAAWIGDDAAHLATLGAGLSVTISDAKPLTADLAANLAPLASQLAPGTNIDITDTRAAILTHAPAIAALGVAVDNIMFSDGTRIGAADAADLVPLESQLAQSLYLHATIDDILTHQRGVRALAAACVLADIFVACGSAAAAAAHAPLLNSLSASVTITDTAAHVAAAIEDLAALNFLHRISLTDGGTPPLAIGEAQLATARSVLSRIASPYILSVHEPEIPRTEAPLDTVLPEEDHPVTVAQLDALAPSSSLDAGQKQLVVWDSVASLSAPGAAERLASPHVGAIHVRAGGDTATLGAAEAVTLFALPGFSTANPDGSANRIVVQDSAAELDAVHDQLASLRAVLDGIVVDAGATITAAACARLLALGATAGDGAVLTVRDSAAAIAQVLARQNQALGESLTPDRWVLSGPAIVTAAKAVALARLPNFTAGPYQLTLSKDATLSVADANALGAIAACISTGSRSLTVKGSAAQRAGLSPGAQALLQPALVNRQAPPETVPAATILRFVEDGPAEMPIPRVFAAADPAAAELFDAALAQDDLVHMPGEFAHMPGGSVPPATHIVSAVLRHAGVTLEPDAPGEGAAVNVYGESGSLLSSNAELPAGFTVTAPDSGAGAAFSITESVDGDESPPVVVLDAGTLEDVVAAAHAKFATSGAIEVSQGKFLDLYTAGSVPVLAAPALVYDPSAHTVALDVPGNARVPLIILGAATPPPALEVSEILVRRHA